MADKKLIRDPIYNLITFDKEKEKPILALISLPEVQRLRRIKQLGFSFYTFPGAVHDRFSHCIGVAYLIGKIIDNLNLTQPINIPLDENNKVEISIEELKLLLQVAGLLHDIGHGPFSHAFERIMDIKHESWTLKIIDLIKLEDFFSYTKSENLKKYGAQWIKDIILGTFTPIWMNELISSQLDADRIDYLLRDSYFCGVSYATFDLKWLIQHMTIDKIKPEDERDGIVIDGKKGIHTIEAFIISRYHMYEQVYFHKTTRCFEILFEKLLKRVYDLTIKNNQINNLFFEEHLPKFLSEGNIKDFLELDDYLMFTYIKFWSKKIKDPIVKELADAILNRKPFKMVKETKNEGILTREQYRKIDQLLGDELKDYYFFEDDYTNIGYKDAYLLGEKGPERSEHIWLRKGKKIRELANESAIIGSLKNKDLKKYRAYVHRNFYEKVKTILAD